MLGKCLESLVKQKDPPGQKMAGWGTREGSLSHPFPTEGKGWGTQSSNISAQDDNVELSVASGTTNPGRIEAIVVDDHSTDGTRQVAERFPVQVIAADPLPEGWVGAIYGTARPPGVRILQDWGPGALAGERR